MPEVDHGLEFFFFLVGQLHEGTPGGSAKSEK
jgi:hypothetical protein